MKRLRRSIAIAVASLSLTGCAIIFPNASEAIAPASFADLWAGVVADVTQWISLLGL